MWWGKVSQRYRSGTFSHGSYDDKILSNCAERLIRRRILGMRMADPEAREVKILQDRVMKAIHEKFGETYLVRLSAEDDNLEPIVQAFVDALKIKGA
jgi:hypothetical protein